MASIQRLCEYQGTWWVSEEPPGVLMRVLGKVWSHYEPPPPFPSSADVDLTGNMEHGDCQGKHKSPLQPQLKLPMTDGY